MIAILVIILIFLLWTLNEVFKIKGSIENNNSKKVSKEIFFKMLEEKNINLVMEKKTSDINKYCFIYKVNKSAVIAIKK